MEHQELLKSRNMWGGIGIIIHGTWFCMALTRERYKGLHVNYRPTMATHRVVNAY